MQMSKRMIFTKRLLLEDLFISDTCLFRIESEISEATRCRGYLGYPCSICKSRGADLVAIFKLEPLNSAAVVYFAIGIEKILDRDATSGIGKTCHKINARTFQAKLDNTVYTAKF